MAERVLAATEVPPLQAHHMVTMEQVVPAGFQTEQVELVAVVML